MLIMRKFIVRKHERGLLFRNGDFIEFVEPGTRHYFDPLLRLEMQLYDLTNPAFAHPLAEFLLKDFAEDVAKLFEVVETSATQVAVVLRDGRLFHVVAPQARAMFWKGIASIEARVFDIDETFAVPADVATVLVHQHSGRAKDLAQSGIVAKEVPESYLGILYVDGKLIEALPPGLHTFWKFNRSIEIELIDMRVKSLEVTGQEILTRDKVSLRINVTASFRYTDPVKALKSVKDPLGFLYKEIQFGLRSAVGTRTLDALLEEKGVMNRVVFEHVRDSFAELGIDVSSVGVKDIILPGSMKEILSKVVEADKVAQANVIRRREETNATRSLLNTAKVMEGNPVAVRLKELETLEKVTEKIGNISVYGGLDSVLSELVRIKH